MQEQLHDGEGGGRLRRGKSAGDITVIAQLLSEMNSKKCLTLKMKVKVTEHNIRNGAIRLQISQSIKDIIYFCVLAFTIPKILAFQIFILKIQIGSTTFAMTLFDGEQQPL